MNWIEKLPTLSKWLERRRETSRNKLPRHLLPTPLWPIGVQLLLNTAIAIALITLIIDRDDYVTEAGPAITMVICLVFLIASVVQGVRLRNRFPTGRGSRWAKLNFGFMIIAFLCWPATVAYFLD